MSYQPEERYWTDYLRIALPIAGLLLLLGVFWYWASSFIGDDENDPNTTPQVAVVDTPITAPTQTPTVSVAVTLAPAPTLAPTQPSDQAQPTTDASQPSPTAGAGENGGDTAFAVGDLVVVNDNDVNLRVEPTTGDVIVVLAKGDELSILDATPVDDGTYVWWKVSTVNGEEGWVAGDFLDPSAS